MIKTSARVLRLLSMLQVRREWSGAELSDRLAVDVRTIRRDVDRLRELGYVIEASAGPGGGYRLGSGTATPPLLLDDTGPGVMNWVRTQLQELRTTLGESRSSPQRRNHRVR